MSLNLVGKVIHCYFRVFIFESEKQIIDQKRNMSSDKLLNKGMAAKEVHDMGDRYIPHDQVVQPCLSLVERA